MPTDEKLYKRSYVRGSPDLDKDNFKSIEELKPKVFDAAVSKLEKYHSGKWVATETDRELYLVQGSIVQLRNFSNYRFIELLTESAEGLVRITEALGISFNEGKDGKCIPYRL